MTCPITYQKLKQGQSYSLRGLHLLSPKLSKLNDFPYTAEEQLREAEIYSSKLSIQGVQPKLSANLNIKNSVFQLAEKGGRYILKPQVERFKSLPENEDLTMRLAKTVGIKVPLHGLIYSKDKSLTYFIRRFDRKGQRTKVHLEDFGQLSGASRDTKYRSTMEKVANIIDQFCTFPAIEKPKLFRQTLFSFLVGNEDMHLKNLSLTIQDEKVELSPAYDLLNSTIVLAAPKEEMALPIRGKRNKLTRKDLVDYYGVEYLGIKSSVIGAVLNDFSLVLPKWKEELNCSFLPIDLKERYWNIIKKRHRSTQYS